MAKMFLDQRDPHGLHDIGVEIEGLRRAQAEPEEGRPGPAQRRRGRRCRRNVEMSSAVQS
jgi:hypothetical protein